MATNSKFTSEYLFEMVVILSKSKGTVDLFCSSLSCSFCPPPASVDLIREALNVQLTVDTRRGASASGPGSAPCGTPQPVLGHPSQMSRAILMEKAE